MTVDLVRRVDLSKITSFLAFQPSIAFNAAGAATFGTIALALTYLQFRWRPAARYMLPMTIGAWIYGIGIIFRFPLRTLPANLAIYLIQDICIVLSPCAFIASVYSLLGQLASRHGADDCLPIKATRIAKVFVWSDVITVMIQGNAAGLLINKNDLVASIGQKIFTVGLILQAISFMVFMGVYAAFLWRLNVRYPLVFRVVTRGPLSHALGHACFGILMRSIFRVIQAVQGVRGTLTTKEVWFWSYDALPLALSVALFIFVWPERYLPPPKPAEEQQAGEQAGDIQLQVVTQRVSPKASDERMLMEAASARSRSQTSIPLDV